MKEAVETGIDDASTAPSGISGGDAVKMHDYINQGKSLIRKLYQRCDGFFISYI